MKDLDIIITTKAMSSTGNLYYSKRLIKRYSPLVITKQGTDIESLHIRQPMADRRPSGIMVEPLRPTASASGEKRTCVGHWSIFHNRKRILLNLEKCQGNPHNMKKNNSSKSSTGSFMAAHANLYVNLTWCKISSFNTCAKN